MNNYIPRLLANVMLLLVKRADLTKGGTRKIKDVHMQFPKTLGLVRLSKGSRGLEYSYAQNVILLTTNFAEGVQQTHFGAENI